MIKKCQIFLGEKNKAAAEGTASRQSNEEADENFSERGIDIPDSRKSSRKGSRKNKKLKPGQYVIDIEPLETTKIDDTKEEEENNGTERKCEEETRSGFTRGASGRSTMDGSVMSGSLVVHLHTGAAPSPISMDTSEYQKIKTSPNTKSYLETDLPVYEKEKDEANTTENINETSTANGNIYESIEKVEENNQGPPQVWISKSLSMEHGLDEIDDK